MKILKEFEDVFRGVDLTEGEIRTLTWIAGWESRTVKNLRSAIQKAQDAALSALRPVSRERVEKVFGGKWEEETYTTVSGRGRVIHSKKCTCSACGKANGRAKTNFCPHCGAPMTDEAVEIRLKELEALKDGSTTD